ncbi:hypothetical protein B0T24DRAFT_507005, partial [Lasiosphaeria ovina]
RLPQIRNPSLPEELLVAASATGSVKAMTCTIVQPVDSTTGNEPVLVIAIRGSAFKIDHVVNANLRLGSRENETHHVVFTGHSTGGAVASLLHLMYSGEHPGVRFSCITFEAPPCASSNTKAPEDDGTVCLSIINEFDFIARADAPYLLCVI